jgi:hypothetical protein
VEYLVLLLRFRAFKVDDMVARDRHQPVFDRRVKAPGGKVFELALDLFYV